MAKQVMLSPSISYGNRAVYKDSRPKEKITQRLTMINLNDGLGYDNRIVLQVSGLKDGSVSCGLTERTRRTLLRASSVEECNFTARVGEESSKTLKEKIRMFVELARFNKPAGKLLVIWPFYWSMLLASPAVPPAKDFVLVGLLAGVITSAGCIINDFWDQEFDKKVDRCKNRPLASGKVGLVEAGVFFMALSFVALGSMYALQIRPLSCKLCIVPLVLLCIYPLMKRITYWAQLVLGITINWGVFLGWSFITERLDYSVLLPMYFGCVFWTLIYDTIYAHQDRDDDSRIGLKSTAVLFGDSTVTWLGVFNFAFTSGFILSGVNASIGWPYFLMVMFASIHVFHQIFTVKLDNAADCGAKFVSNKWVGAVIFIGILLSKLFRAL